MRAAVVLILFFIVAGFFGIALGATSNFDGVPNADLIQARDIARERIDTIDAYTEAKYGIKPALSPLEKKVALDRLLTTMSYWRTVADGALKPGQPEACTEYFSQFKRVVNSFEDGWRRLSRLDLQSLAGLMAKTRVSFLQLTAESYIYLAQQGAEGGIEPIVLKPKPCALVNRKQWLDINKSLGNAAETAHIKWLGQVGIANAFALSGALTPLYVKETTHNYYWFAPKLIAGFALFIAADELLLTPGRAYFARLLGAKTSPFIQKGVVMALAGSYGGYLGYRTMHRKQLQDYANKTLTPDPWTELQVMTTTFLSYPENLGGYVDIALNMDIAAFNMNRQVVQQLQSDIYLAYNRYHSLAAARAVMATKLDAINKALEARGVGSRNEPQRAKGVAGQ